MNYCQENKLILSKLRYTTFGRKCSVKKLLLMLVGDAQMRNTESELSCIVDIFTSQTENIKVLKTIVATYGSVIVYGFFHLLKL